MDGEGDIRSVTKRSSLETTFNMAAAASPPSVLKHFFILLITVIYRYCIMVNQGPYLPN